uniref:Uncharacterized protein n=1 Tax=Rhizophora mucronata TaxID=61149 RepID=A0A2P2NEY4_RHIMU
MRVWSEICFINTNGLP